ncbi:MAG: DUF5123 domain-containing protein [Bacteroidia bacterium]|nr:DUF5123 domain-containing protein [Bacteroidia bacterium]
MNRKYLNFKTILATLFLGIILVVSCQKEETLQEAPRLFRPVVSGDLLGAGNWLGAEWTRVKGATSYTAEISLDTFKTVVKSVAVDTNIVVFQNLEWLTLYQIHVRANAAVETKNSGFSLLGARKTEKFPSIMATPTSQEILDKAVLMHWTNTGAAVTNIKVTLKTGGTLVKDVPLVAADITNQYKVISGLTPLTTYVVTLYSGTTVRGYETITTVAQIITGTNIVDLSQGTDADVLTSAYFTSLTSGTLIILKRGMTYNVTGTVNFDKPVSFVSEVTFFAPPAKLNLVGNFNFASSSNVSEISFKTVDLIGSVADGYGSRYVFNINVVSTIAKITFEDCKIKALRGILRAQAGPQINTVSFNKCLIDSISNYGVVNCDNAASGIQNVILTNSTVSATEKLMTSKSNLTSLLINNCTFYAVPMSANYFLDYNTFTVSGGVTINNSIFSVGKPSAATPPVYLVNGFRPATVSFTTAGNFKTSDLAWAGTGTTALPGLTDYTGVATALFKDPVNDDFTIIDSKFAGKSTAGDPRWRP